MFQLLLYVVVEAKELACLIDPAYRIVAIEFREFQLDGFYLDLLIPLLGYHVMPLVTVHRSGG